MLTSHNSPLVGVVSRPGGEMEGAVKVKMLRNTFIAGKLIKVGQVVDVDTTLALLLLNSRKAGPVSEEAETTAMEPAARAVKPKRVRKRKTTK